MKLGNAKKSSPIRILLNPRNQIIPILIGLGVAGYLFYSDYDAEAFNSISWSWWTLVWFSCAFLMVVTRDIGYMYRIRVLTNKEIKWGNAFDIIMLWEFASAISPSVVGGSGVALFIVNKEGIKLGRSTAVVMVTALMDELFYILMVPLVIFIVGSASLFPVDMQKEILGYSLGTKEIFVVGYIFIFILTSIISFAVFIRPQEFRRFLIRIFSLRILKRWRKGAVETGSDIVTTSTQLKKEKWSFWAKAFGATLFSWTARFWVVNFLIMAVTSVSFTFGEHMLIYARQLVMWVIMLISPTPGSAGIAEFAFKGFLGEFIMPIGLAASIVILWRLLTYFLYLILGTIVLPNWIRRTYLKRNLIKFKDPIKA